MSRLKFTQNKNLTDKYKIIRDRPSNLSEQQLTNTHTVSQRLTQKDDNNGHIFKLRKAEQFHWPVSWMTARLTNHDQRNKVNAVKCI